MDEYEPIHVPGEADPPGDSPKAAPAPAADSPSRSPIPKALAIAVLADVVQLLLFPLFAPGALSPLNDVVDIVVFIILVRLLGWHWVFLPSLFAEVIPGLDEIPCWTLAVLTVRAGQAKLRNPE